MDSTHIHLILNHFPIVGILFGIAILSCGLIIKNKVLKNTAFVIFILTALVAIPVFLTGEAAEDRVEDIAGVSESLLEEHEETAEKAIWVMQFLGLFSVISLLASVKNLSFSRVITFLSLVLALLTFGIMAKVGNLGGQIRHSEIRDEFVNRPLNNANVDYDEDDDEHEH